mgnify:CR=1 FL=1
MKFSITEQSLQLIGTIAMVSAAFATTAIFKTNNVLKNTNKKLKDNKALLKELLEGFGLEIPSELHQASDTSINQLKSR